LRECEQKARGAKRKYDGKVDLADLTRLAWVRELQSGVELYTAVIWHVSLKRKISLAYLLDRHKPNKPSYGVLFSTDINQSGDEIYRFYKLRFHSRIHLPRC
jgi:hypothetical protein